ncbi:MAG: transporter substrate-binding domain-containing protein [Natronospirillum sp.]|uniref:transporter substrate-binding domain-containing protein n=1 Tax=Natronospirillum sp. TaxID=2812955 RepID=UPI0025D8BDD1|nr:transporter substrate-binding domain-containing protein [Natronospirillum sp.]MCH8552032.1 transporter substrate-binding domain-containing protein [Natronospirillum sp.]
MNRIIVPIVVFAVAGLASLLVLDFYREQPQDRTIRLAVDVPYEPFEYYDSSGNLTGFEIELGDAVCAEMQLSCQWVVQAWDGIIDGLLDRRYEVIFSSMSITPDRAERVLFSEPYYTTPSGWFVRTGSDLNPDDPASLLGMRVGVQRGTIQDNYITNHVDGLDVRRYSTADDFVLDLEGGRLDAIFVDFPVGEQTILSRPGFESVGEPVTEPRSVFGDGVGAAFHPDDRALADVFNEGLERVKQNGTYEQIMNSYFNYDIMI